MSIVLPITLVTIAALIVLVCVLVCLLVRKQKTPKKRDVHPDSGYTFLERSQQSHEHSVTTTTAVEGNRYIEVKYIKLCESFYTAMHVIILLSHRHMIRQFSIVKIVDNPIYGKDRYNVVHHLTKIV